MKTKTRIRIRKRTNRHTPDSRSFRIQLEKSAPLGERSFFFLVIFRDEIAAFAAFRASVLS